MKLRMVRDSEALESVAQELLFTESRLKSDEHAKDLAPPMSKLISDVDQVRTGQVAASRDEVTAHAAVAAADDQLDDCIKAFDRGLQDVVRGNTESPRYRRYFAGAPWTYIRLGLESEISRVGGWPASLAGEPEQPLKDWGQSLTKLIAQGQAALEQRRQAVAARKDHRVRSITSLIEEINTARATLYGDLAKKAASAGLPIDWPSRFFRRSSRPKEEEGEVPAPPAEKPAPATTGT